MFSGKHSLLGKITLSARHFMQIPVLCGIRISVKIMAISEFEKKRCERELQKFVNIRRPPPHMRSELDLGYRIKNQSIEIFEIRPESRNRESKIEIPLAKTTYVKSQKLWKIYWQRQDLRWHSYQPVPEVEFFEDFLAVVHEDVNACFFG